jgi:hypothetical protein
MSVTTDRAETDKVIARIEQLKDVAASMARDDDRRSVLLRIAEEELREAPPVRPAVAAHVLGLSEKTVRAWVAEGVLTAARQHPRLLLDLTRIHQVLRVVEELRAAGQTRGLLDEVYRRLQDASWADNPDLQQSLGQMRRGEGIEA